MWIWKGKLKINIIMIRVAIMEPLFKRFGEKWKSDSAKCVINVRPNLVKEFIDIPLICPVPCPYMIYRLPLIS